MKTKNKLKGIHVLLTLTLLVAMVGSVYSGPGGDVAVGIEGGQEFTPISAANGVGVIENFLSSDKPDSSLLKDAGTIDINNPAIRADLERAVQKTAQDILDNGPLARAQAGTLNLEAMSDSERVELSAAATKLAKLQHNVLLNSLLAPEQKSRVESAAQQYHEALPKGEQLAAKMELVAESLNPSLRTVETPAIPSQSDITTLFEGRSLPKEARLHPASARTNGLGLAVFRGRGAITDGAGVLNTLNSINLKSLKSKDPEVAALKYSAGNLANELFALSNDMKASIELGVSAPEAARYAKLIKDSMDDAKQAPNESDVKELTQLVETTLIRITKERGTEPKEMVDALEKLRGALVGISKGNFKNSTELLEKANKQIAKLDFRKASTISNIFNVVGIAGFAVAALHSIANATFIPLPSQLTWGGLLITHGGSLSALLSSALPWASIAIGISLLGILAKEGFIKYYNPVDDVPKAVLIPLLPLMAGIEEVMFRLGLLAGTTFLASFAMPFLPAVIVGTLVSSVIFARVHGYGPALPRFLGGVLFGYLMLTQGLLFSTTVHTLHNLLLFVYDGIEKIIQRHTAK